MDGLRRRRWALVLLRVLLGSLMIISAAMAADVEIMPISELKPGMTGYCLTALSGFEPERLGIEILGVVWGQVPGGRGILFIGTDDKFRRFGILAGMSGSPCYIDGKLIGALSYGWFAEKEPIGGITPIEEMLTVLDAPVVQSTAVSGSGLREAQLAGLEPYIDDRGRFRIPIKLPAMNEMFCGRTSFEILESSAADNPLLSKFVGVKLSPIPLSFVSNFGCLDAEIKNMSMPSAQTGKIEPYEISPESLVPGCPLGEALITGDLDFSGMGTLTYRDGDTILAYGHSSYGAGSVSYPMCSGVVHTGFPSYIYSHKITSSSKPLGVITQDRYPAVAGKIGAEPDMLPVTVWLTGAESGKTQEFHFEVIRDRYFTPILLAIAADYSVFAQHHESGEITIDWDTLITFEDRPPIRLSDSYSNFAYGFG
ncbi:MAG: hypothetical protein JW941_08480 [Candidatus Coatesbacteria bacterium]|nr:hypothetical protein [Candidatus Coatesbacteria bacterium]